MPLTIFPCLDSDELAAHWRTMLDMPRDRARMLGESAVAALARGYYDGASGERIPIRALVDAAVAARRSLPPDASLPSGGTVSWEETVVTVGNLSTLTATQQLEGEGYRPLALNFANGANPGGGFLHGARAQEEGLCRASGLHATLEGDPMYAHHRTRPLPDSTPWCILSPRVPVFRDDAGEPLPEPWLMDVLTCAAPYAPALGLDHSAQLLRERIDRVLAVAHAFGYEALVLGAWGCGAFGNDPAQTARDFRAALEGPWHGKFRRVSFAITDWSPERQFLGPFREVFR